MMNSTNPYLTAKASARKKTDSPLALVCAIFAAATASSTVKMFSQGKTLAGVMGILIFAALATPIFRILRRAYRRACAHRIAGVLLPLTEESLTFERLGTVLSSGNALEQLQSLIGKGYLQNLRIDSENRTVGLYIPEGALVQWVCASCGAKNRARRGGPMRCKYCDQPRGQLRNTGPKAAPPNSAARLALSFPPPAACGFLVLHPIGLRNLHLHSTKKIAIR